VFYQFPAYSAVCSVKIPQTARKYREQAAYEAIVMGTSLVVIPDVCVKLLSVLDKI
jgi:hypothetical protein